MRIYSKQAGTEVRLHWGRTSWSLSTSQMPSQARIKNSLPLVSLLECVSGTAMTTCQRAEARVRRTVSSVRGFTQDTIVQNLQTMLDNSVDMMPCCLRRPAVAWGLNNMCTDTEMHFTNNHGRCS